MLWPSPKTYNLLKSIAVAVRSREVEVFPDSRGVEAYLNPKLDVFEIAWIASYGRFRRSRRSEKSKVQGVGGPWAREVQEVWED